MKGCSRCRLCSDCSLSVQTAVISGSCTERVRRKGNFVSLSRITLSVLHRDCVLFFSNFLYAVDLERAFGWLVRDVPYVDNWRTRWTQTYARCVVIIARPRAELRAIALSQTPRTLQWQFILSTRRGQLLLTAGPPAVQQSIDISCPLGPQQQNHSSSVRRANAVTDIRMDGRTDERPTVA